MPLDPKVTEPVPPKTIEPVLPPISSSEEKPPSRTPDDLVVDPDVPNSVWM